MRTNKNTLEDILIKYRSNAAGFAAGMTNLFTEFNGEYNAPYPKQVEYMNLIPKYTKIITVRKSRQVGMSTAAAGKFLHSAYFREYNEYLILSRSSPQAEKILGRIKKAFNSMEESLFPGFSVERLDQLQIKNGPTIYSFSSNPDTAAGFTGPAIMDEFALFKPKDAEELYRVVFPSTTKGGNLTLISTPRGAHGLFYRFCTEDINSLSKGKPHLWYRINMNIYDVPFQMKMIEELRSGVPIDSIWQQEYLAEFLGDSEESIFSKVFMLEHSVYPGEGLVDELPTDPFWNKNGNFMLSGEDTLPEIDNYPAKTILEKYEKLYAGWDIALGSKDLSQLTIIGRVKGTKTYHVIFKKHWLKTEIDIQCEQVTKFCNWIGVKKLVYDATGLGKVGGSQIKKFKPMFVVIPYLFNIKTKNDLYMSLRHKISQREFLQNDDDEVLEHFSNVMFDPTNGKFYTTSDTRHDDHCTSQALALRAAEDGKGEARMIFIGDTPKNPKIVNPYTGRPFLK